MYIIKGTRKTNHSRWSGATLWASIMPKPGNLMTVSWNRLDLCWTADLYNRQFVLLAEPQTRLSTFFIASRLCDFDIKFALHKPLGCISLIMIVLSNNGSFHRICLLWGASSSNGLSLLAGSPEKSYSSSYSIKDGYEELSLRNVCCLPPPAV